MIASKKPNVMILDAAVPAERKPRSAHCIIYTFPADSRQSRNLATGAPPMPKLHDNANLLLWDDCRVFACAYNAKIQLNPASSSILNANSTDPLLLLLKDLADLLDPLEHRPDLFIPLRVHAFYRGELIEDDLVRLLILQVLFWRDMHLKQRD